MGYKLLVSDIDGTLVDRRQKIIPVNKEAIKRLSANGFFSLATGRMFDSIKRFVRELEITLPLIIYNGAQIVDSLTGEIFFEKRLEKNIAKEVLDLNKIFKFDAMVYYQGSIYVERINKIVKNYMKKDGVSCFEVENLSKFIKGDVTKILFIGDSNKLSDFLEGLKSSLSYNNVNAVKSEKNYLEILPAGISKGVALEILAKQLNVALSEVIAIGDNLNDLEMIKKAGLGVATRNAHSELIKAADYVTFRDNEEGSVAEVIYSFFI